MITIMKNIFSSFTSQAWYLLKYFWSNLSAYFSLLSLLDIILVSLIFFGIYYFLKDTRAINIIIGIILLSFIAFWAYIFKLQTLFWLIKTIITGLLIAIPVIFQPELRSALERLGRISLHDYAGVLLPTNEAEFIAEEVSSTCEYIANRKWGALIVVQENTGLHDYARTGVILEAKLSMPLLLSIINPKSPLHDGAIIIKEDKILAAGCTLPLSEYQSRKKVLGMRHKAALGISEQTDAAVIIVSEETGKVSRARSGRLYEWDFDKIKPYLVQRLTKTSTSFWDSLKSKLLEYVKVILTLFKGTEK